ncbi:MAG: nucleotidyltransferase family protein [Candidatus Omnitrophica bacterium]|nr:nucleotidyltransferase family protein [Candidatus Omnitrophota bacterium]
MKTRKDIKQTLKEFIPLMRQRFKVKDVGIFGSYARGEETARSDIDILVEFSGSIGWEFIDLKEFLEEILDRKVDLVTIKALKPQLKDVILKEVKYV